MSAIAGCIGRGGAIDAARSCADMLRALGAYGSDTSPIGSMGQTAFGRNLFKTLPEDDYDDQPLAVGGDRFLVVADSRLDNRSELANALGLDGSVAARMSDAAVMAAAWERWGPESLERVFGDYALAVWDAEAGSLFLARSPFGLKPLFYHSSARIAAFASMPAGLHALSEIPKAIDMDRAAAFAAEIWDFNEMTIFAGVKAVEQGTAVWIRPDGETIVPVWQVQRPAPKFGHINDFVDAFRQEFDRAVAVRTRRHHGRLASQLSSGRDSTAVTVSAAQGAASAGEELLTFTGSPRAGFGGPVVAGRLADESELASRTAAMHDVIRHFVCRPSAVSPLDDMVKVQKFHHRPISNPSSLPWWARINDEAAANGATVLLVGSMGNFTVSAGGDRHLRDLLVEHGAVAWLGQTMRMAGLSPHRWRQLLQISVAPSMPRRAYSALLRAAGRGWRISTEVPILRSPWRERAEQLVRQTLDDARPPRSFFDFRREMLMHHDHSEKMSLAVWGIDVRDPTVDQRFVELCFSLPVEQLVSASAERPVYEAAFRDRIPAEVLANTQRGYQCADWFELFRRDEVEAEFQRLGKNRIVSELLDLDYIRQLIEAWPRTGWEQGPVIFTYRNRLLGALSLASFIELHFPD